MHSIERAELAAKKTAERLRKAKLADAEIRYRAACRRGDKITEKRMAIQALQDANNAEVSAIEAEISNLKTGDESFSTEESNGSV